MENNFVQYMYFLVIQILSIHRGWFLYSSVFLQFKIATVSQNIMQLRISFF
jgi:hypothetical protein